MPLAGLFAERNHWTRIEAFGEKAGSVRLCRKNAPVERF
jgi:hypothetical protein